MCNVMTGPVNNSAEWMTGPEVQEYLKIQRWTLSSWVKQGILTRYRVGPIQTFRYRSEEVKSLMITDDE